MSDLSAAEIQELERLRLLALQHPYDPELADIRSGNGGEFAPDMRGWTPDEDAEFRYHAALVKAAPRLLAEVLRRRG